MSPATASRRPFLVWLGDVLCGLVAYVLSRWIWQKHGGEVFDNLLQELATFAGTYVLLRLVFRALGIARRSRAEARAAQRVLEKAAKRA